MKHKEAQGRARGFKLQPWSHWVHWHLHQDPPSYSLQLFRNNTFSPFNSWELFFLLHSPQNETIHSLEGRERRQHRKANWIECVEFEWCLRDSLQPCMSSRFFLYYSLQSYRRINKGGGGNDMWKVIHCSCQRVIFAAFKPRVNRSYSLSGEGDLGRNQLTHPDIAGECMETPHSEQNVPEIGRKESQTIGQGKVGKWENVASTWKEEINEEMLKRIKSCISGKKNKPFTDI